MLTQVKKPLNMQKVSKLMLHVQFAKVQLKSKTYMIFKLLVGIIVPSKSKKKTHLVINRFIG